MDKQKRKQWLKNRQQSIGASDAAAVLGVSPYKSPLEVWAEKTGMAEEGGLAGDNPRRDEAAEFGIRLEPVVAKAFADRTGRKVLMWPQYESVPHYKHSWMTCTPDATQTVPSKPLGALQIKTSLGRAASDWNDGPPLHYEVQVQHEMAVLNAEWATLCVLLAGPKLVWYDIERNDRFIDVLIEKLAEFWAAVQSKEMPEIDGTKAANMAIKHLHPSDDGSGVWLPPSALEWIEQYEQAREDEKAAKTRKMEAENHLRQMVGDATYGVVEDTPVAISLKTQERPEHVQKASKFRVLRMLKPGAGASKLAMAAVADAPRLESEQKAITQK